MGDSWPLKREFWWWILTTESPTATEPSGAPCAWLSPPPPPSLQPPRPPPSPPPPPPRAGAQRGSLQSWSLRSARLPAEAQSPAPPGGPARRAGSAAASPCPFPMSGTCTPKLPPACGHLGAVASKLPRAAVPRPSVPGPGSQQVRELRTLRQPPRPEARGGGAGGGPADLQASSQGAWPPEL